jgi:serine/threonine protein kinase
LTTEYDDVTETISEFVSEYGLLVDAYSLGCTIRYMVTGVPPHKSVSDAISDQEWSWITKLLCGCASRNKSNKRTPHYRYLEALPGEVQRLVKKLTETSEKNRTSVRSARRYPWIADALPEDTTTTTINSEEHANDITYLNLALKHHDKEENDNVTMITEEEESRPEASSQQESSPKQDEEEKVEEQNEPALEPVAA